MFDSAALALKRSSPKTRPANEVLGARVNLYKAAKKWDMAIKPT
jgi:hypothetical protein